ncbi:MAG: helix-turn-helix transcriptional regulator [Cyclobacteriaceae bacterium]
MPTNRKALIRYKVYDRCLRNSGRKYNQQDLLQEVNKTLEEYGLEGIKRSQFYKDIAYMKFSEWHAPIDSYKEGRVVYYFYKDRSYSINNQPLNEEEVERLKSALLVLSRFKGVPQLEGFGEILSALDKQMGKQGETREVISLDSNLDYAGLDHIDTLFHAIIHKKVLKISYQPFTEDQPTELLFHPSHLRQYNQRWFVLGFNPEKENPAWNLALDRIQNIEETDLPYVASAIDWEEHFEDIIGVTRLPGDPQEIRLRFTAEQAPFVKTKPLHHTQHHYPREDGSLEVTIQVVPNFELEKVLLAFGEKVEVLAPLSLRERLFERIRKNYEQYLGKMTVG